MAYRKKRYDFHPHDSRETRTHSVETVCGSRNSAPNNLVTEARTVKYRQRRPAWVLSF